MPHHRTLAIHPAPFKSSYLSIPASPFSPCSPLTPAPKPRKQARNFSLSEQDTSTLPVPSTPMKWVWTCHACARAYPLGATRRCLDDGHAFCAGTTVIKSWRTDGPRRRVKKHRACTSEFDYAGWKTWGRWRRSVSSTMGNSLGSKPARLIMLDKTKPKNCWTNCDYPSHCRWGKRVGIHTPTPTRTEFSVPGFDTPTLNTAMADMPILADCFTAEDSTLCEHSADTDPGALGRALEASAKRRKSIGTSPTSPLSASFSAPAAEPQDTAMQDVEAPPHTTGTGCIDPALLALEYVPYTSAASPAQPPSPSKASETIRRIRCLLSNHKSVSRRHVAHQHLASRRGKYVARGRRTQDPLPGAPGKGVDDEVGFEGLSPLEEVVRWSESAVKVGQIREIVREEGEKL